MGPADREARSSRRYRQTHVASLPFRRAVHIMVNLGSKIRRQPIQFFVWNTAAGFNKSLPEGFPNFARRRSRWWLVLRVSLTIRLAYSRVLLQFLQRFGDQSRDRLTGLTRQRGEHAFLLWGQFKRCRFHIPIIPRRPRQCNVPLVRRAAMP